MKDKFTRILALTLALVMVLGAMPLGALAEEVQPPYEGETGDKTVVDVIEADTGQFARNAVHGYVGMQVGGDLNLPLRNGGGWTLHRD